MAPAGQSGERGSSPVSAVLIIPVFLSLVFGLVQVGMMYHAQNVAHAAAAAAYNAARLEDSSEASGHRAAADLLGRHGTSLSTSRVTVHRGATSVSVTVTGRAPTLVPLWSGPAIAQEVSGPTERWISR